MKKSILIIIFGLIAFDFCAQSLYGEFPVDKQSRESILTSGLLTELNWNELEKFCDTTEGQYTHIYKDSLITRYQYVKQGRTSYFELRSFNGKVLSFESENSNVNRPTSTDFFDKSVWLEYAHIYLPNLPDSLKMSINTRRDYLVAYYKLLGVGSANEYGWICEYSTVGSAPSRRRAVIQLRLDKELLLKILEYPNPQTQMYAADALIFEDYATKQSIKQERDTSYTNFLKSQLLTKEEWNKIYRLRDSNVTVLICGNSGSYKIYESTTKELLSKKAIKEIPKKYEFLSDLGYLKLGYNK